MTASSPAPAPTDPSSGGSRQIQILAGLVFAALIVVVVIVLLSGRGSERQSTPGDAVRGETETRTLLAGLTQQGATLGDPKAPVTIVEFVDLQCPFCAAHQLDEQPKVIDAVVRSGEAKITLQPLAFLGPDSGVGRNVFLRLANKNHGWDFLNLAYWNQGAENSGYMDDAWLKKVTSPIPGVTAADLSRVREPALRPAIDEADGLSEKLFKKGDGTPFFAVGPSDADPATYKKVDLAAKSTAADSIIAAVRAAG